MARSSSRWAIRTSSRKSELMTSSALSHGPTVPISIHSCCTGTSSLPLASFTTDRRPRSRPPCLLRRVILKEIAVPLPVLAEAKRRRDLVLTIAMEHVAACARYVSGSVAHGVHNKPLEDADCGVLIDRRFEEFRAFGPDADGTGRGPEAFIQLFVEFITLRLQARGYPNAQVVGAAGSWSSQCRRGHERAPPTPFVVTSAGTQEELRRWSGTVDDLSHRVEDEDLEVAGGPRAVDVEAVVLPAHESPQPWLLAGIGGGSECRGFPARRTRTSS
jgi:hypothetical protein